MHKERRLLHTKRAVLFFVSRKLTRTTTHSPRPSMLTTHSLSSQFIACHRLSFIIAVAHHSLSVDRCLKDD
jgi:hypothetical protein